MVIFIFINGWGKKTKNIIQLWKYRKIKFQWPWRKLYWNIATPIRLRTLSDCFKCYSSRGTQLPQRPHGLQSWKYLLCLYWPVTWNIYQPVDWTIHSDMKYRNSIGVGQIVCLGFSVPSYGKTRSNFLVNPIYGSQTVWSLFLDRFEAWQFCIMKQRGEQNI